jgi:hypothetical protein
VTRKKLLEESSENSNLKQSGNRCSYKEDSDHVALFMSSPFEKIAREVVHFLACQNVEDTHYRTALKAYLGETLCRRRGGWGGFVPSNATYLFPSERNYAKVVETKENQVRT